MIFENDVIAMVSHIAACIYVCVCKIIVFTRTFELLYIIATKTGTELL